ncbi:MAG: hypothetical protein ACTSP8_13400 [Promethearchaeota archaeon]
MKRRELRTTWCRMISNSSTTAQHRSIMGKTKIVTKTTIFYSKC